MPQDEHDGSQGWAAAAIEDADAGSNHDVGMDGDDQSNADQAADDGETAGRRP